MKAGYDAADAEIFRACMPVPAVMLISKPPKKTPKGKKVEDADYQPPPEAEEEAVGDQ
jgi:hypothetical protein